MKRTLRNTLIGLTSVTVLVVAAISVLSASAVTPQPLAAFDRPSWDTAAEKPCPAPQKSWASAVRGVLARIEDMEVRLEDYSTQLEAVERGEDAVRMAETLDLEGRSPARALEDMMGRFKKMVDAYGGMDEGAKKEISNLDAADKVEALTEVAADNDRFNAYFDALAKRRQDHVALQAAREMAVFEAVTALRLNVKAHARHAELAVEARKAAEQIAEAAREIAARAVEAAAAAPADPCTRGADAPQKNEPKPPADGE